MFYYLCKLVITSTSVLYPLYASYKALRAPITGAGALSPQEQSERLERWLMYWCVVACVWTWEQWAEWSIAWFPFYHEGKTLVMLWLVLPQIQGSTYIYLHHLSPFLTSHEQDIDAALADARTSATRAGLGYANAAAQRVRAFLLGSVLGGAGGDDNGTAAAVGGDASTAPHVQPPVLADPGSSTPGSASGAGAAQLAQLAGGLFRTYGPAALAAGHALLHPMAATGGAATSARATTNREDEAGVGSRRRLRMAGATRATGSEDSERDDSDVSAASSSSSAAAAVAGLTASTSFEEIKRDEIREFTAAPAGASAGAGSRRKSGGWFGWGGGAAAVPQDDVTAEKKRA